MSKLRNSFGELAERYASALFDLVSEAGLLDRAVTEITQLRELTTPGTELAGALSNPVISSDDKAAILNSVAAKSGFAEPVANFLGVLGANRRADALHDTAGAFLAQVARHRGVLQATITSATPLSAERVTALTQSIAAKVGGDVDVDLQVKPEILGGLIIQVGSRMFDDSLRTKLSGMEAAMKGA